MVERNATRTQTVGEFLPQGLNSNVESSDPAGAGSILHRRPMGESLPLGLNPLVGSMCPEARSGLGNFGRKA